MGKTLSAAAGLSASSARDGGDWGALLKLTCGSGNGSPLAVKCGLFARVADGADPADSSLSNIDARVLPFLSSAIEPLRGRVGSCSEDIAIPRGFVSPVAPPPLNSWCPSLAPMPLDLLVGSG